VNHLSRLVAVWVGQGGTQLSRKAFDDLALSIRRDVHPRTQLEQLQHAGTISVDENFITLVETSYQPLPGSDDQLRYLAQNGGDFLNAATSNVLNAPAPFFERAAHFNQLSDEAISMLEQLFQDKQMALLEEISAKAAELQESDPGAERFRAGTYFYRESSK